MSSIETLRVTIPMEIETFFKVTAMQASGDLAAVAVPVVLCVVAAWMAWRQINRWRRV